MSARFPEVEVQLSEEDGNSFVIIGRVTMAMKAAGVSASDISAYQNDAMSGDYDHLLRVTMRTVTAH